MGKHGKWFKRGELNRLLFSAPDDVGKVRGGRH